MKRSLPNPSQTVDETQDTPAQKTRKFCLLFHTVDGVIPYMTPLLLQKHFAPDQDFMKYFLLGISVREACCVPIYPKAPTPSQPEKSGGLKSEEQNENEVRKTNSQNSTTYQEDNSTNKGLTKKQKKKKRKKSMIVDPSKPCGYTFESTPIDSFLAKYAKVVVPSFDFCQDAIDMKQKTHSNANHVMVWTPNGRHALSPEVYHKAAKGFILPLDSPDNAESTTASVSLYDMALDTDSSKRKVTAMKRIDDWLTRSLSLHGLISPKTGGTTSISATKTIANVWAPLLATQENSAMDVPPPSATGKEDNEKDLSSAPSFVHSNSISQYKNSINGLAVVGWHHITSRSDRNERLQLHLKNAMKGLCSSSFNKDLFSVAVLTTMSTLQILDAARLGVNVIGTGLPTLWAKSKKALVCNLKGWEQQQLVNTSQKRPKIDNDDSGSSTVTTTAAETNIVLDENGCIDLHDICWVREGEVLVPGCTCIACNGGKHSKAYIHHLVQAKEMLAEILLFGHNLHHLLQLYQEMSLASAQGQEKLETFCNFVESQLPSSKNKTTR